MTIILNIICKLGAVTNIAIGPSPVDSIKTAINIFAFALSCGVLCLSGLK